MNVSITDGYARKTSSKAGSKSVTTATTKAGKTKTLSVRLSPKDRDITESVAMHLKQLGYKYSEGDAVRIALRLLNSTDSVGIAKVAEDLKGEDGRRK